MTLQMPPQPPEHDHPSQYKLPPKVVLGREQVDVIIRAAGHDPASFPRRGMLEIRLSNALWLRRIEAANVPVSHAASRDKLTAVEKAANGLLTALGLPEAAPDLSAGGSLRHAADRNVVDFGLIPAATFEIEAPSVPGREIDPHNYTPGFSLEGQLVSDALRSVYQLREWARRGSLIQASAADKQIDPALRRFDPHVDTRDTKDTGDSEINEVIASLCRIWAGVFERKLPAKGKRGVDVVIFVGAALAALEYPVPGRPQKKAKRPPKLKLGQNPDSAIARRRKAAQADTFRKRVSKAITKVRAELENSATPKSA